MERILISPDQVASIGAGDPDPHGAVASLLVLGRADANRRLFFHFPVTWPETGSLRSATLLLTRASDVDMAPAAVELHAVRIIDPWDARSISWPLQPRIEEARTAHTLVAPAGSKIVRLDVLNVVRTWPMRDPADQGIAVVADNATSTGTSFAYISSEGRPPELEIGWAYPDTPAPAESATKENKPIGVKK